MGDHRSLSAARSVANRRPPRQRDAGVSESVRRLAPDARAGRRGRPAPSRATGISPCSPLPGGDRGELRPRSRRRRHRPRGARRRRREPVPGRLRHRSLGPRGPVEPSVRRREVHGCDTPPHSSEASLAAARASDQYTVAKAIETPAQLERRIRAATPFRATRSRDRLAPSATARFLASRAAVAFRRMTDTTSPRAGAESGSADPADLGVLDAARQLATGRLSAIELTEACLRRIEARNGGPPTFEGAPDRDQRVGPALPRDRARAGGAGRRAPRPRGRRRRRSCAASRSVSRISTRSPACR